MKRILTESKTVLLALAREESDERRPLEDVSVLIDSLGKIPAVNFLECLLPYRNAIRINYTYTDSVQDEALWNHIEFLWSRWV